MIQYFCPPPLFVRVRERSDRERETLVFSPWRLKLQSQTISDFPTRISRLRLSRLRWFAQTDPTSTKEHQKDSSSSTRKERTMLSPPRTVRLGSSASFRRCVVVVAASPNDAYSYSDPSAAAASVAAAASQKKNQRVRRPENAPGAFYVDSSCINCDVCRRIAPETFSKIGPQSAVHCQPPASSPSSLGDPTTAAAAAALISCPTASIHAEGLELSAVAATAATFLPCAVPGVVPASEGGPPVLFLGYTSGKSFGASAYLLLRPKDEGGNIMVDSPRFDARLASKIQALGGAEFIFLTHRDDVADHARWASRLGSRRVMHSLECNAKQGTDAVEAKLEGSGPWTLRDCRGGEEGREGGEAGDGDVRFVLQPGHTEACVAMLHAPSKALFSGDVVSCGSDAGWFSEDGSPRLHA